MIRYERRIETMTNEQIIFEQSIRLMQAGVIGTTGRKMLATWKDENGEDVSGLIDEPEPLHTFADWKSRGYFVRKGEKAKAKFTIWNYTSKPGKATKANRQLAGTDPEAPDPHYYMKESYFFTISQTTAAVKMLPAII